MINENRIDDDSLWLVWYVFVSYVIAFTLKFGLQHWPHTWWRDACSPWFLHWYDIHVCDCFQTFWWHIVSGATVSHCVVEIIKWKSSLCTSSQLSTVYLYYGLPLSYSWKTNYHNHYATIYRVALAKYCNKVMVTLVHDFPHKSQCCSYRNHHGCT